MNSLSESLSLHGKIAIVTGASRGIGRTIAERLAALGASVLLTARDEARLQEAVTHITAQGGRARSFATDLRDPAAPEEVARKAVEAFGGIDIVVNNAGATKRGDFSALTDADWQDGFALKFFGAVRLTRAAWPQLKQRHGALINIAGVGGRTPGPQFTIGGSVNAAVVSFTKAMADVGIEDSVRVMAINPGFIRTDRFQVRLQAFATERQLNLAEAEAAFVKENGVVRIGETLDVANLVAYLVSPLGEYLHGSTIDLHGGQIKTL